MKRSVINGLVRSAENCFQEHGWSLPPKPRWDVTDFGLGDWQHFGLVLVNLAEEQEYCEKIMYAKEKMQTPAHCHWEKKEDIICRWGKLAVQVWAGIPHENPGSDFIISINHSPMPIMSGRVVELNAGSRITLLPGMFHAFYPLSEECIIGEVSTANDDQNDNFFFNPEVGRYPGIEEDEAAYVPLISDKSF